MNTNLHIHVDNYKTNFTIMQYNVDMSVREEKYENTKWNNRKDRVASLINVINADIVCLQEMRKLEGTPSINEFLSSFNRYHYKVEYRNPGSLAFGNAILYKPDKFYPLQTVKRWLSTTPNTVSDTYINKEGDIPKGFGYIIMGVQFQAVQNDKIVVNSAPFWVFNTHLGLEEKLKTESCHQILDIVKEIVSDSNQEFIICGDFNFFPDRDGDKQRAILTDKGSLQDLGKGAITINGKPLEGTFVGYEHDDFKADLKKMVSRLDHVFGSKNVRRISDPILITKTMKFFEPTEELTDRNLPSDHLPLLMGLEIN